MSTKSCDICGELLKDNDPIVAIIEAHYHDIPSDRSFSMTQPTDCYDVAHLECYHMDHEEHMGVEFDD
jgi:hypothetical protein